MHRVLIALGLAAALIALALPLSAAAQQAESPPDGPPFSFPLAGRPGPNTWLYEQHYGNTTEAFNFGDEWYMHGQGLHFGLDIETTCGTPVLAIADGVVTYVDAEGWGAGPHSLVLVHPGTGLASFYGHLLRQPSFVRGDTVKRGEVIGLSGDPDLSCRSRPHLHLEIRRDHYQTALSPLPFFDMNWHMLVSIGPFVHQFQQDLSAPFRWMTLETQPAVHFSANLLNNYQRPWPPKLEQQPPESAAPARRLPVLPAEVRVTRTPVALSGWNVGAWWHGDDLQAVYVLDALPGGTAVFRQPLDGSPREPVEDTLPAYRSPDGSIRIERDGGVARLTRLSDGAQWEVATGGAFPAVSPDGTRLLWQVVYGETVPGMPEPGVRAWVSGLDGGDPRLAYSGGGRVQWLDDHRLLINRRITYTAETQLYIVDLDAERPEPVLLGGYENLHDVQVAPGGEYIAFYLPFQENPADSGVYVQRTTPGSLARKLPFFGAYRWRDDRWLYTLSFDASQDAHALGLADALTRTHRWLTDPETLAIRVANGDWSVSPDGTRIVYVDPEDYGLYLLEIAGDQACSSCAHTPIRLP
ncbi:MAG: M23 family metallopeptidase [Chloroflexota bacterium]